MRQLVSVIDGRSLAYFVSDGDGAEQIAQIVRPEHFGVDDVVRLGVNLSDALALNGIATSTKTIAATVKAATPALPPAPAAPGGLKKNQPVLCPECERTLTRRSSLTNHLVNQHGYEITKARQIKNSIPAVETPVERERRGPKGRRVTERKVVADTWPKATVANVYAIITRHPEGVSIREIALELTDDSHRGRQTIGNRLSTLRGQGLIRTTRGFRPHFRSGTPQPTSLYHPVKAK